MNIEQLRELIADIPNHVDVTIETVENIECCGIDNVQVGAITADIENLRDRGRTFVIKPAKQLTVYNQDDQ